MILFIYGSRGAGVEVYDLIVRNRQIVDRYEKIYFVDDFREEGSFYGTKTIHFTSCRKYADGDKAEFIIAAGEPKVRKVLIDKVKNEGYPLTTIIDETAIVSETAQIADGCIINANAIISSEVVLEENCLVMFQAIIGHHAHVGENCVICPKATVGGYSKVGKLTFLGLGSSMMQGVDIGNHVIVGMGAMVFKSVDDGATVVGNPARITKGNAEHKVFV